VDPAANGVTHVVLKENATQFRDLGLGRIKVGLEVSVRLCHGLRVTVLSLAAVE
jgi:hypothetical protein